MTAEQIQQARDWLNDCEWSDLDDNDINEMPDASVIAGIARHYDGGIQQFITDGAIQHNSLKWCNDNCLQCQDLWASRMEREHNVQ